MEVATHSIFLSCPALDVAEVCAYGIKIFFFNSVLLSTIPKETWINIEVKEKSVFLWCTFSAVSKPGKRLLQCQLLTPELL